MMDEAFLPFEKILEQMLAFQNELVDQEQGVRSYITRYEIETPVELDIVRDVNGELQIGSAPPIYYVDTAIRPSYHKLSFIAEINEARHGD